MKISLKKSFNRWVKGTDGEEYLIDYPTVEQHQHLQSIQFGNDYSGNDMGLKYYQYLIKYVIKDWKGIVDEDGKPVSCKLVNNELETELWWSIVSGIEGIPSLGVFLSKELEFTENDKKKFSSQASSAVTTNSQDGEKNTQ